MTDIFLPTLSQIAYLFVLIFLGYFLSKKKIIPNNSDVVLSKLESYLFIPALILSTFMSNFKVENMAVYGRYFLIGFLVASLGILIAIFFSKIFFKSDKLYTYSLAFSNFGFMGNAVVLALFPSIFTEYLIFVLPLWLFIYLWGVPLLLKDVNSPKMRFTDRIKVLINPMIISMIIGIIIGLTGIKIVYFVNNSISTLASLMTPVAMLVTGITIARIELFKMIKKLSIYFLSFIRLIFIPLVAIIILYFVEVPYDLALCIICALSMPLGLNSIIILNAYGFDAREASAMALISHVLSIITIPLIFVLFNYIINLT